MSDASCRLVSVLFDMLDEVGVPHSALTDGSSMDPEMLRDERNWITWAQMCVLLRRTSVFVGGNDNLRSMCTRLLFQSSGNRSMTRLVQAFTGPKALYRAQARWISKQLFSMITWRYEDVGPGRLRMHLTYEAPYEVMPQLPFMVGATLVGLPTILGLPEAVVHAETEGRHVTFHVQVAASRSIFAKLKRTFRALFAPNSLVAELEEQARNLESRFVELREAQESAEQASRTKSQFLANISHELRTPLNGILGTAQLLSDQQLDPAQLGLIDTNRSSAEHLLSIIDRILEFTELGTEEITLEEAPFDPVEVVDEVVQALRPQLRAARNRLVVSAPDVSWTVQGDRARVSRVLEALIDNATRFTEDGEIQVRVLAPGAGGKTWVFEVRDDGVGMDDDTLATVFAALTQGDNSMTRRHGGIGLGLSLAYRLVQAMGGTITCESTLGHGTHVWFSAPLEVVGQHPAPGLARPPEVALACTNGAVRDLMAELLTRGGVNHKVFMVDDPLGAFAAGDGARVVLTDSEAVSRRLDQDHPDLPHRPVGPVYSAAALRDVLASVASEPLPITRCANRPGHHADAVAELPVREGVPIVLIVEDSLVNRIVIAQMVERLGYETRVAVDGREGFHAFCESGADVVLMDIQMPVMDGHECTRRIRAYERERGGHVPIVAVTAHALQAERVRAQEAGMDRYLTKPVDLSTLRETLHSVLGSRVGRATSV